MESSIFVSVPIKWCNCRLKLTSDFICRRLYVGLIEIILTPHPMKIENGPKMNTKILRFLKMDQRRIWRIFVNSKINLSNLQPKIFQVSKILLHLKMNWRWRRRWIFGQKSSKLWRSSKLRCNTESYLLK